MKSVMRAVLVGGLAMLALSLVTAGVAAAATPVEFKPVPKVKTFKAKFGSTNWWFTANAEYVACTGGSISGEITGASTVGKIALKYTGCTGHVSTGSCSVHSTGSKTEGASGEIIMTTLDGELGTANENAALLLKPVEGTRWTTFDGCYGYEGVLSGTLGAENLIKGRSEVHDLESLQKEDGKEGIREFTTNSGTTVKVGLDYTSASVSVNQKIAIDFEEAFEIT